MVDNIIKTAEDHMKKSIELLRGELAKMRTGRAHPSLLEHLFVSYYGNDAPLNQIASIVVSDARTLTVTPWDKNMTAVIEKAIIQANLGLNPTAAGQIIRVPLPPLTEERRKEMVKLIRREGENTRVAVRNVRRDANAQIKTLLKDKSIGEDEEHKAEDNIQKLTDKYIAEVDQILDLKEKDLMQV